MQKKNATKSIAPKRHKVLVVDDHPMTRDGVAHLINKQPELEVCADVGSPAEAFETIAKLRPDLVLTDMTMPGRSGLEFIKDLLAAHPTLVILVLSMHDEAVYAERVLRAGARGYIMKEAGGENLLTAIRRVLGGQVYLSEQMAAKILDNLSGQKPRGSHSPIQKLSDREFEIFQLIGQGKSTRDIANELHISPKTVDVHRSHIKEKLKLIDATSLIRHAVRWVESQEAKA
ncbi:MAG: two component transcriptional regulator, LuxR family [Verrucomicrobiales bacterium]|nr:two component transcriptional regulator, LuxR family [Verrucomicrobiales bacterium]